MDAIKPPRESRSSTASWLRSVGQSRAATRLSSLGIRSKMAARPKISEPFGPVKNSRGADFTRSDTFLIVDGIKDCGASGSSTDTNPTPSNALKGAQKTTPKRKSAGFAKVASSMNGKPKISKPGMMATTVHALTDATRSPTTKPPRKMPRCSSPMPLLKSSLTATIFPDVKELGQDENAPLMNQTNAAKQPLPKSVSASKLPKSRTMSSIPDVKGPTIRPSLNLKTSSRAPQDQRLPSNKSTTFLQPSAQERCASTMIPAQASQGEPQAVPQPRVCTINFSRPPLAQTSQSSLRRPEHPEASPTLARSPLSPTSPSFTNIPHEPRTPSTPDVDPRQVTTAQPSEYWSGRYMTIHDQIASENLKPQALYYHSTAQKPLSPGNMTQPARIGARAASNRQTCLSSSTTTMALTYAAPPTTTMLDDEDEHSRRVFARLETFCITNQAKASLFEWQQAFARRQERPGLLPAGGTMEPRSIMSKFFSGRGKGKSERGRLSAIKETRAADSGKGAVRGTLGHRRRTLGQG